MKKLLAILMALVLMLSGTVFAETAEEPEEAPAVAEEAEAEAADVPEEEESEWIPLDILLTNSMDFSAADWYESSLTRALLTVLLIGDLHLQGDYLIEDIDLISGSYVANADASMLIYLHTADEDIVITYSPILERADYLISQPLAKSHVELFLTEYCGSSWQENSLEDLVTAFEILSEALAS